MLEAIYPDGTIEWFCRNEEAECEFCTTPLSAHIDHSTVRYLSPLENGQHGAVIALPKCICGMQMFLKADYTRKEMIRHKVLESVPGPDGQDLGLLMKIGHVRNLLFHHMMYEAGKAPVAPILPLPPKRIMRDLLGTGMSAELALSVWWTYDLVSTQLVQIPGFDPMMLNVAQRALRR
jgi:hypothetical protein